ncbi:MAG TPA: arginine--tRNA ligase [Candidatus Limnocylindria bacterium]|jgi:arginyl-tRNA synthetase|nr:arginine--tRNA ligase [Candidatus Limnocylindria bacterium]
MNPTTTSAPLLTLDELAVRFADAARALYPGSAPVVTFEAPRRAEFGDVATNLAFGLAKIAKKAPPQIASAVIERALADDAVRATLAEATAVAGFINLRLVPAFWQRVVADVLRAGAEYGKGAPTGERISLEFGSANPTGPLVVVQGRTLSIGDTLAKAMRHAGFDVFTEWIINDAGSQLDALGRSVFARYHQLFNPEFPFPEDGYPGDYLIPIAEQLRARDGEKWLHVSQAEAAPLIAKFARDTIVAEQQVVAHRFGVDYDLWQSEKELHADGAIERGIARLRELGVLYEKDGATWLRTTASGDDDDRVVIRSDGRPTYYAGDVAYHYEKLQRADHVIDILGPDHHGYIARLNALANAYGRPGAIEVLIAQQITLKRGEEILSMSKRAGTLLTLQDVIDEVGVDAARFFFVMLSTDQPLTFDLELAKKQSSDNPVYYVQYGHARIASVLRRAREQAPDALAAAERGASLERLVEPAELTLIRRLAEFGATVAGVARSRAPHRLPKYARDVAADFHQFYDACRVLSDDAALTTARLGLVLATKTVLASTLHLCGVSAPESM